MGTEQPGGFGSKLRAFLRSLLARPATVAPSQVTFGLMYDRFREILSLNNGTLEFLADLEERLSGRKPFAMDAVAQRVRKAALDVFVMIKDLNQIAAGHHAELYDALRRINGQIEAELESQHVAASGPLVLPLAELRSERFRLVGNKMASLGEVAGLGELRVPPGFAVTTVGFVRFMSENDLWRRTDRLEAILEADGPEALGEACQEVQQAIRAAPLPTEVAEAILGACQAAGLSTARLAVRSSAVGEDLAGSSHAGLYTTRLGVSQGELLAAYREVLASAFSASAVTYRFDHGLTSYEAAMGVGCLRMVEARCAGILFSRQPDDVAADPVLISSTAGLGDELAAGEQGAEMLLAVPGHRQPGTALLQPSEVEALVQAARLLEAHFGAPQDIEWAIDGEGQLFILQARPLLAASAPAGSAPSSGGTRPLLIGGFTASPGVGAGPVAKVRSDQDIDRVGPGCVLVSRFSSPKLARVMRRCAAIICDVGSPTGHMSILAREYRVPAIVGMEGATRTLIDDQEVTVDATSRCVLAGRIAIERPPAPPIASLENSPVQQLLRRVARLVIPLHLTDPADPGFTPAAATSLHDLTRFVHEKAFEVMFHYGDLAAGDRQNSFKLKAVLPIDVLIFDVGGGIRPGAGGSGRVGSDDISSVPLRAFLAGLLEERIRWDLPRAVSMRGFLAVVGESIASPPPETQRLGRASYAIISDRYLNFSTKAGYHFSTVDTFCDHSPNKNYIHFRFAGGAADEVRRFRRVRFLATVLSALDFKVNARRDLLVARLDKSDQKRTSQRLVDLGRLTLCVRQLDMLMSSDAVADQFARHFLAGEWERF